MHWITGELRLGPFLLRHEPSRVSSAAGYELAGHLHPVLRLRDGQRDAMRLPGFWQRPGGLVLPAFGSFTGGHAVRLAATDRFHAIAGEAIVSIGAGATGGDGRGDRRFGLGR